MTTSDFNFVISRRARSFSNFTKIFIYHTLPSFIIWLVRVTRPHDIYLLATVLFNSVLISVVSHCFHTFSFLRGIDWFYLKGPSFLLKSHPFRLSSTSEIRAYFREIRTHYRAARSN